MTQDKIKKIHRWYGWALTALLGVAGILFILSCLDIYADGPRSYSAEAVVLHFRQICIPVYLAIVGIVGGILLNLFLPCEARREKARQDLCEQMLRMRKKTGCAPVAKEVRLRLIAKVVTGFIFVAAMVYPLIYFLTPEHFTVSNLNGDILKAVLISLIPAVICLLLCWGCQVIINRSFRRETDAYKQALAAGQKAAPQSDAASCRKCNRKIQWTIRGTVIIVALALILLGIQNGGAEDVLKKAIAICTECIGLG